MKKINFIITAIVAVSIFSSCSNSAKSADTAATVGSAGTDVWAETVESKTLLYRPEGMYDDTYWNSVHKNVDVQKMLATISDAVLNGKQKAYDMISDSALTIDEVKARMEKVSANDIAEIFCREKLDFDKEKFSLDKKVSTLAFTIKKINEEGQCIGDKPLFYVKLN